MNEHLLLWGVLLACLGNACAAQQRVDIYTSSHSGNWEIYAVDAQATTGTPSQNLTRYPASERFPDYAKGRQTLVFSSDRQGSFNLYLMDLQGQNVRPLAPSSYPDVSPRWSPDETQIVFVSAREGRNENLYVLRQVFSGTPQLQQLTTDPAADYDPAWHPKGKTLLFISERSGAPEIYRLNLGNLQSTPLTNSGEAKRYPVFSPQGDQVAFARQGQGSQWQLCWAKLPHSGLMASPTCTADSGWIGELHWEEQKSLRYTEVKADGSSGVYRWNLSTGERQVLRQDAREMVP